MKLLYVYAEFLDKDGKETSHRGFSRLSLNFSTDRHFSYHDGTLSVEVVKPSIPKDFFGDRIYNVTTLIGDNGTGKTTILHYLIDLLQQFYKGQYDGNDCGFLVIEDKNRKYVLYYGNIRPNPDKIPEGYKCVPLEEERPLLSATKLIYIANTLTYSDFNLVQQDDGDENDSHFRYKFLYNCSTASLMIEDFQNDIGKRIESAADYLDCFFAYEQYKQVKYVFDKRQFDILEKLRKKGHSVPVPKKLFIELQRTNYNNEQENPLDKLLYTDIPDLQYDLLQYELCYNCLEGFLKSVKLYIKEYDFDEQFVYPQVDWGEFRDSNQSDREKLFTDIFLSIGSYCMERFQDNERGALLSALATYCSQFIGSIVDEKLKTYFEMEPLYDEVTGSAKKTITFSIKTSDEEAKWFVKFLQNYRYTCEPYYYLQFRWGLSSGEQNLLRLFSSLYYIFGADYTNPRRGDYKIYNKKPIPENACDSVMLFIDEADLTYHPEWQRCFLSILTAFLPEIYPKTSCKEMQIFLTTHSPLMLGDSPAQSVIYLSKDAEGNVMVDDNGTRPTFGENLYTLLQNSFRVQNGAIGEMVRIKINNILNTLRELDEELPSWRKLDKPLSWDIQNYQTKLRDYKDNTIAFLADGIIKTKLESEIDMRLQQLEEYLPEKSRPYSGLSDEELEKQLSQTKAEMTFRREDLQ